MDNEINTIKKNLEETKASLDAAGGLKAWEQAAETVLRTLRTVAESK